MPTLMRTFDHAGRFLGSLEERVMEVLWTRPGPMAVREVCGKLKGDLPLAYTTVMTTLDRLFKKGLLKRHKDGSAFVYETAMSRDDYRRRIVESTVSGLIERSSDLDPVLAAFVDAAADVDEDNLKRLEELIAQRRRSGR
ncbi:MAG: BlaI/MecI/CopY family transcriptional regulator [Deltaproteobacteria bacterium]|nr:BlaI/MecI/CopY family transcriptional regulator [Deltaproteobacteria bacterium]